MKRKAGFIPYIFENGILKFMFMVPSDENYGGLKPQIAKGEIDEGEDVFAAAIREAEEELGLIKTNIKENTIAELIYDEANDVRLDVFIGEIKDKSNFNKPHYETGSVHWLTYDEYVMVGKPVQLHLVHYAYCTVTNKKFDRFKNTIYLDLDGVLADFDKFVLTHLGRTFDHKSGPQDKEMWDYLKSVPNFYLQLEPTPYAQDLVELSYQNSADVQVLTAIPRRASIPSAEQDKIDWVKKVFHSMNLKVNIGPYSADKWKHAKPGDILIDDRIDNIQDWVTKGQGVGILHKYGDYQDTKNKFLRVLG